MVGESMSGDIIKIIFWISSSVVLWHMFFYGLAPFWGQTGDNPIPKNTLVEKKKAGS